LRRAPLPHSFKGRENTIAPLCTELSSRASSTTWPHATAPTSLPRSSDQPVFLLSESYEDERLLALIKRASELAGAPEGELVYQVGVFTAEKTFARLYPAFFAVAGGTRAFLLSVERFIHELVRATIPNASPPRLNVQPLGDDGVTINYTSSRRLCPLLAGLVEGTACHYGEEVQVDQTDCMLRDDPACVFEIRVSPGTLAA
jgi:hypothetical protein